MAENKNFDPISDAEDRLKIGKKESRLHLAKVVKDRFREMDSIDSEATQLLRVQLGPRNLDAITTGRYVRGAMAVRILNFLKLDRFWDFKPCGTAEETIKDFKTPKVNPEIIDSESNSDSELDSTPTVESVVEVKPVERTEPTKVDKYTTKTESNKHTVVHLGPDSKPNIHPEPTPKAPTHKPIDDEEEAIRIKPRIIDDPDDNEGEQEQEYGMESSILSLQEAEELSQSILPVDLLIRLIGQGRTEVFIDASNVFESQKLIGVTINYRTLRNFFYRFSNEIALYYYNISINTRNGAPTFDKFKPIHDWLRHNGFNFVTKHCIEQIDAAGNKTIKGNMDTYIVTDMVASITRGVKNVILFSGDGDYLPALTWLKDRGINTIVISPSAAHKITSKVLRESASLFVALESLSGLLGFKPFHQGKGQHKYDHNDPL